MILHGTLALGLFYIYLFICLSVVSPTTMQSTQEPGFWFLRGCKPRAWHNNSLISEGINDIF